MVDIRLDGQRKIGILVSHLPHVIDGVHGEAKKIGDKAETLLAEARSTTTHVKFDQSTAHETEIEVTHTPGEVDSFVVMDGSDAVALEYGHAPSGVFGPGGRFGHTHSKTPHGLYILHRAAGFEAKHGATAPTRRLGKR